MPFIGLRRPPQQTVAPQLQVGDESPGDFLSKDGYTLVVFLRHIGCPFAEALVKELSALAESRKDLRCVAVCHGAHSIAEKWLGRINLSSRIEVQVDSERVLYGNWGVGYSGILHLMKPGLFASYARVFLKGNRNRDASGTRWQKHAAFLIDSDNTIIWKYAPKHAGDLPKLYRLSDLLPAAHEG